MKKLLVALFLLAAMSSLTVNAQQSKQYDDYTVHYNALNSSLISPEAAKAFGIRRSDSRALINITVLKSMENQSPAAVRATVTASGRNLTGQTRVVEMREINENNEAIYYIGELSVRNMETFDFTVMVTPEGQSKPFKVEFRQQFYTE
ncbi:MAG: DUF4426 domain-containing protein [Xanthomonadales bacterium]|nr:DUF4426 domain-containing protein [Xanthomonadales bacterium]